MSTTGKGGRPKGSMPRDKYGRVVRKDGKLPKVPKPKSETTLKNIRDLARRHSKRAITILSDIMEDAKQPGNVRVAAAKEILDRGHGKAVSHVAITDERETAELTDQELTDQITGILTKVMDGAKVVNGEVTGKKVERGRSGVSEKPRS